MLSKLIKFFKEYKQLGLVIATVVVALPLDIFGKHDLAHIILAVSAIGNSIPLVIDMYHQFRGGTYGIDILAATAIVTSVILGEYWAGMIIVLMLTGGEALEDYAANRAKTELSALLAQAPKKARILRGRKEVEVLASVVKVKDKIIIRAGELVPVDAVIIEGTASFDESSLTGESLPVTRKAGDELLSGSINLDGAITAQALRTSHDSQYEQIIQLVKSATASKSPLVRLVDRYSIPFTVLSFTIAFAAWAFSGESIRFLEVLVVATPCPLILAAPIAMISGMSRSAKHGIIIKNGAALERLADINTLAFDKTGTLTKGRLVVSGLKPDRGFTSNEVLRLAAAVESNSNHLVALAITEHASRKKVKLPKAKNIKEIPGLGLVATVQGQQVLVGRADLLRQHSITIKAKSSDKTVVHVAIDGKFAGVIGFEDELRPEAKRTLAKLKDMGVRHFMMITGDNKSVALKIAKTLGIEEVHAETLPTDKLMTVENAVDRPIGFVGDGVNDAPVLAAADVGIALGARGSAAASESADVIIMMDDLERVATGVSIAKRTLFIAKQSIWVGILLSFGLMLVFSTGRFRPVYGAAIQEVVDVIVIFNALRAHGAWKASKQQATAQEGLEKL